jgi:hypothetical protein
VERHLLFTGGIAAAFILRQAGWPRRPAKAGYIAAEGAESKMEAQPVDQPVTVMSPTRRLQLQMTSRAVLGWIAKTWTAEELKRLLAEARRREPALRVLAHKNGRRTREPADIQVAQKHLLVNAFAAALYMMAKGGPNDGDAYYEPMLARNMHVRPEQVAELPVVAAALRRWEEAGAAHLT